MPWEKPRARWPCDTICVYSIHRLCLAAMWLQVLSINKALPLQAHPTSDRAGAMHEAHPDVSARHTPTVLWQTAGLPGSAEEYRGHRARTEAVPTALLLMLHGHNSRCSSGT